MAGGGEGAEGPILLKPQPAARARLPLFLGAWVRSDHQVAAELVLPCRLGACAPPLNRLVSLRAARFRAYIRGSLCSREYGG